MKIARILALALVVVLAMTGCTARNNKNGTSSAPPVASAPSPASSIAPSLPDVVSEWESGMEEGASRLEEGLFGSEPGTSEPHTSGPLGDVSGITNESVAAAMSTDFSEIGALSGEKVGWGSGGPTDAQGRPEGATLYQQKYGKYDASFLGPNTKQIYLTFDEGYENGYTSRILDTLKEKNTKAVFFITYPYAKSEPALVRRMIEEGHTIGNHSTKHLSFPDMPLEEAAKDILKLHNYVKANYGYEMWLFRAPEGVFSEQVLALVQSLGYKSVFWSFAYRDWETDNQPVTIEALDKIVSKCHPGAIYLLHAVSKSNTEVLGEAIDRIRADGYTFANEFYFT